LPGLAAAGLFAFISAWGDFLLPLILPVITGAANAAARAVPCLLRVNTIDYGFLAALAFIYLLPAVIAFGFARQVPRPDLRRRRQGLISRKSFIR
jgi:multiple sugar transport system permease protein